MNKWNSLVNFFFWYWMTGWRNLDEARSNETKQQNFFFMFELQLLLRLSFAIVKSYHSGYAKNRRGLAEDHRCLAELARRLQLRSRLGSSGDARVGVDVDGVLVSSRLGRLILMELQWLHRWMLQSFKRKLSCYIRGSFVF